MLDTIKIQAEVKAKVWDVFLTKLTAYQAEELDRVAVADDDHWPSRTAGHCKIETGRIRIRMNMQLLQTEEEYRATLIHEWAHAIDWILNARGGHGRSWKQIDLALGDDGDRCHHLPVSERLTGYVSVPCKCGQVYQLSPRLQAKMRRGEPRWCSARTCRTPIKLPPTGQSR